MMLFFCGMHHPSDADKVRAAFVSIRRIRDRKSSFPCRRVIIDSGAYREIDLHGGYERAPEDYGADCVAWKAKLGRKLLACVAEDYMCEAHMLARTGLSIAEHQRLTILRYDALTAFVRDRVYILPVLQGYAPEDYAEHVRQYGARLKPRMWVGVGSLCKRNADPSAIEAVLLAILHVRPDLRLHGFGIKTTALFSPIVRKVLFSADSMAWSYEARFTSRDRNSPAEARRFADRVNGIVKAPVTKGFFDILPKRGVRYAQS
jgi:hypothetical protein